uniref:Uncharacterized protein n=1 Tax=Picea glauca TaxID=3330 RepID=A0A117NFT2_PICGL|nr:hypothetical protein ABT39_MTgene2336 [Picea glauca]QHR89317.1 hypothetical protein Q903MT_gene3338 [Picea sitchensis]
MDRNSTGKSRRRRDWYDFLERVNMLLHSWTNRHFSRAGGITLIQSVGDGVKSTPLDGHLFHTQSLRIIFKLFIVDISKIRPEDQLAGTA